MIKVIIERKVMPECLKEYEKRALQMQQLVFHASGFIASEAFFNARDHNHRYVIVSFDNEHNWYQWYKSDTRQEAIAEMMQMLEEPEKITIIEAVTRK